MVTGELILWPPEGIWNMFASKCLKKTIGPVMNISFSCVVCCFQQCSKPQIHELKQTNGPFHLTVFRCYFRGNVRGTFNWKMVFHISCGFLTFPQNSVNSYHNRPAVSALNNTHPAAACMNPTVLKRQCVSIK